MFDVHTIAQRHANMAAIRGKDTKPEIIVRKYLWRHGFRYRLNHGRLPGKPDIVLRQYRTCIFVNGCFWHGHDLQLDNLRFDNSGVPTNIENSECCKIPKTNREFWVKKILRNKERDVDVQHRLARMGWHCITVWECELKADRREATLASLVATLNHIYFVDHNRVKRVIAEPDEEDDISAFAADDNCD